MDQIADYLPYCELKNDQTDSDAVFFSNFNNVLYKVKAIQKFSFLKIFVFFIDQ